MNTVVAENQIEQKIFLTFRRKIYSESRRYVDNFYYMLTEIFSGELSFTKDLTILPTMITDDEGKILCEGIVAYAPGLPEYIQLCFFESLPGADEAVKELIMFAEQTGRGKGCERLVIGLYGHVNYGLGFLSSHYEECNSFSSPGNPKYYNDVFRTLELEEIKLNSYFTHSLDDRLLRYERVIKKLSKEYEFRFFDRKHFKEEAKIYTDLNNACFPDHRYYYNRPYEDDEEMLKELFLFMGEDSLIYAFHDGKPVGFILWYPDYNELAKPGEIFGTKHYFKNRLMKKKIKTAKVMEYGVLEEYRGVGLPLALIAKAYDAVKSRGLCRVETSWILDENEDSNSFCRIFCDEEYKEYVVYEKPL